MSNTMLSINQMLHQVVKRLPFSVTRFLEAAFIDEKSILDAGAGKGTLRSFKLKGRTVIASDIYLPYLRDAKAAKVYEDCILCDVRMLPFKDKSFNVVLANQLLEHLTDDEGIRFLENVEKIARNKVVITTPSGFYTRLHQHGNIYEQHKSGWLPNELECRGYVVRGYRLKLLTKICNLSPKMDWLSYLDNLITSVIPITYFLPKLAGALMCIKVVSSDTTEQ
jgi:hypothetical protein